MKYNTGVFSRSGSEEQSNKAKTSAKKSENSQFFGYDMRLVAQTNHYSARLASVWTGAFNLIYSQSLPHNFFRIR